MLNGLMRYYGYDAKRPCRLEANNLLKAKVTKHAHWASGGALRVAGRMRPREAGASGRLQVLVSLQEKKRGFVAFQLTATIPVILSMPSLHSTFSLQCGKVHVKQHDYDKCQKCVKEWPIRI